MNEDCSCNREGLYRKLLDPASGGDATIRERWESLFAFDEGRALRSFMHRIPLQSPAYVNEHYRYEWIRAFAETLYVGLDIGEIIVHHRGSEVLHAPGSILRDSGVLDSSIQKIFVDERTRGSLYTKVSLYGDKGALCRSCKRSVESFINKVNSLWEGNRVKRETSYLGKTRDLSNHNQPALNRRYSIQGRLFNERVMSLGLVQPGVSDALETVHETVLSRLLNSVISDVPSVAINLFNRLFGIQGNEKKIEEEGLIDPWTFKVVHKKNRRGEDGFGYTITRRQLKYIYDYIYTSVTEEKRAGSDEYLPDIEKEGVLSLWDKEGNIYGEIDCVEDEVVARTIETTWQLQNYDGFVRSDNGFMREPRETGITAYADVETYEPLVDESPVGEFEKTFIHKPWIIEVPVHKSPNTLDAHYGNKHSEYRGVAWLMSNCPIPPTVRLSFLDTVRDIEHTIVRLTDKFMATAGRIESRIRERQKRRRSWLGSHRQRYIRGLLDEAKRRVKDVEVLEDTDLSNTIETARFLARRFSGNIDRSNIKNKLRTSIKSIYRHEVFVEPSVEFSIGYLPSSPKFNRYLVDLVSSLAENSARNVSGMADGPSFYIGISSTQGGETVITVRDSGEGVDQNKISTINKMFAKYIRSWKRGVFLSSDRTRWSTKLQALTSEQVVEPDMDNGYKGWYGIISEIEPMNIIGVELENIKDEVYNGLEVRVRVDFSSSQKPY